MKIKDNDIAPRFEVVDIYGAPVSLESFRGKKVYLSFFRNTACPFCNIRVIQLAKVLPGLIEEGLVPVFFFESPGRVIKRSSFCDQLGGVHLVGDPEKEVYGKYGVSNSLLKMVSTVVNGKNRETLNEIKRLGLGKESQKGNTKTLIPADFLINEQGEVEQAYYASDLNDRLPIENLEAFVRQGVTA